MEDLPSPNRVNILLQECLKVGGTIKPKSLSKVKQRPVSKNIQIKLVEKNARWSNYSVSRYVWSSFRVCLEIDNYKSDKPDYVSISIIANLVNGEKWIGDHFIFNKIGNPDEEFRIEANEMKKVHVFISNRLASGQKREPMPEISKDPIEIIVSTRSGEKFKIQLKRDQVSKG